MSDLNQVSLIGRLGQDPESRNTSNDNSVCNFSLATSEKWKNKDGETQEKTEWHRIVAWGKLGEICQKYLEKGKQVFVQGKLQTRKWEDKDGNNRYTTEVVIDKMQMLGGKGDGGGSEKSGSSSKSSSSGGYEDPGFGRSPDDDIPF